SYDPKTFFDNQGTKGNVAKFDFKQTKSSYVISHEDVNNNNIDINSIHEMDIASSRNNSNTSIETVSSIISTELRNGGDISSSSNSNSSQSLSSTNQEANIIAANRRSGLFASNVNYT